MNDCKVSVVLVVHDAYQKYLKRAVDSLKTQSTNCEIIVVENNTETLAKACNAGLSTASGEYLVRVDADDWTDWGLIEQEADFLDKNPDIDCVWCDYWHTEVTQTPNGYEASFLTYMPQSDLEHACGAMYRREVYETLGGYDETLERQEAFDFWHRFKQAGFTARRIAKPLYFYRKHNGSMSSNLERRNQARIEILEKHDGGNIY